MKYTPKKPRLVQHDSGSKPGFKSGPTKPPRAAHSVSGPMDHSNDATVRPPASDMDQLSNCLLKETSLTSTQGHAQKDPHPLAMVNSVNPRDSVTQAAAERVVERLKAISSQSSLQDIANKAMPANEATPDQISTDNHCSIPQSNTTGVSTITDEEAPSLEFHWGWDKEGKDLRQAATVPPDQAIKKLPMSVSSADLPEASNEAVDGARDRSTTQQHPQGRSSREGQTATKGTGCGLARLFRRSSTRLHYQQSSRQGAGQAESPSRPQHSLTAAAHQVGKQNMAKVEDDMGCGCC